MPAHVEYLTAADGVRIACAIRGRGPAVIWMPPLPARHLEVEWEQPDERRWLDWLSSRYTLVQYDPRGLGLSDRTATRFTLDALERDLDAVVDRVGAERVVLLAKVNSCPLAIAYAVRRPERVSHLILWCGTTRVGEGIGAHLDALVGLAQHDWELFVHAAAHLIRGWTAGESAQHLATLLQAAFSPEVVPALVRDALPIDVTQLLGQVRCPTLVLHRRGVTWVPMQRAVELASSIPNARLVVLEGNSMSLWSGDMSPVVYAFDDFLGPAPATEPALPSQADAFRCEGEYWTLHFAGRLCRLRDAKGLHHIAHLLGRPGEHVAAIDLLAVLENNGRGAPAGGLNGTSRTVGDAGPVLDARARSAYRRRLEELRSLLEEAQGFNDEGRAAAARTEIEFIEDQLAAAVGLSGRYRRAASPAERARLTVTKRIKGVVERIGFLHPALGDHLSRTIRTGLVCTYAPEPGREARWSL